MVKNRSEFQNIINPEVLDVIDLKSIWRICFKVEKVKATDYTGVINQKINFKKDNQLNLF